MSDLYQLPAALGTVQSAQFISGSCEELVVQIIPDISRTCSASICGPNIIQKIRNIVENLQLSQLAVPLTNGQIVNVQVALFSVTGE